MHEQVCYEPNAATSPSRRCTPRANFAHNTPSHRRGRNPFRRCLSAACSSPNKPVLTEVPASGIAAFTASAQRTKSPAADSIPCPRARTDKLLRLAVPANPLSHATEHWVLLRRKRVQLPSRSTRQPTSANHAPKRERLCLFTRNRTRTGVPTPTSAAFHESLR